MIDSDNTLFFFFKPLPISDDKIQCSKIFVDSFIITGQRAAPSTMKTEFNVSTYSLSPWHMYLRIVQACRRIFGREGQVRKCIRFDLADELSIQFSNLLGTVYCRGNLLFTPDGTCLLSPVGNRVSCFDLVKYATAICSGPSKKVH